MCGGVRGRIEVASFANQPPTGAKLPRPASHKIVQARWEHRDIAPYLRLAVPNYPRRQQYRRLVHAGEAALGSAIGALFGLLTASTGAAALAGLLLLAAVGMGLYARHWLSLAGRSRVGAGRRMTYGVRSLLSRRRGGGFGTRCRGKARETSTRWRSRRPALLSRSRPRPGRTTSATSLGCASRWPGCHDAAEDGRATVPLASCASSVRGASSASSTTF